MGRIRNSYTSKDKLIIIAYAEAHGNRAAGREFNVGESSIREWRRMKERLKKMPRTKQAERGTSAKYPEVESGVLEWVMDRRKRGIAISTTEIRFQAILIAKQKKIDDFKGSVSWAYAFLRRNDLSIRRRTHIAQKLPEDHEDKLLEFQRFIIKQRRRLKFELSQIGNADQTPMTFDLPSSTTVHMKGANTVSITTTGNEKNRFTVMLACTADGGKLPPYVIFKRKTLPKGAVWPKGIIVRCQEKGWMDETLMNDWIKHVWGKRPGGYTKKSLLVLDAFRCHKSDHVKDLLKTDYQTTLGIIPGGMTSMLQPLDVSINKPMKTMLKRKWNEWYAGDQHTFTPCGNMRKPELTDVCQWIADAWAELDPSIIIHAFKKCCISNKMDGTEDDILWEDNAKHEDHSESEDKDDDEVIMQQHQE